MQPNLNSKKSLLKKIYLFIFPFDGIKINRSVFLLILLAFMLAIRIGLGYLTIPIKIFGISVSFAWIPVYVVGWFYGPLVGFVFGFICDSIDWLLHGSIWFWMYAIQEPIVGLISGLISSCYHLFKNKSLLIQAIILELLVLVFFVFIAAVLISQFDKIEQNQFQENKTITNKIAFIILITIVLFIFLITYIIQNIKMYRNYKINLNNHNYLRYMYISTMIMFSIFLFSFLLGPIINIKYIEYLNGVTPNAYLKYGIMYYLIPRILKESIKTPIYILIVFYIVSGINYSFKRYLNNLKCSWTNA